MMAFLVSFVCMYRCPPRPFDIAISLDIIVSFGTLISFDILISFGIFLLCLVEIGSGFFPWLGPTLTEFSVPNTLFCLGVTDRTEPKSCRSWRHWRYGSPHI